MVVIGQMWLYSVKLFYLVKSELYSGKRGLYSGKIGCIRAKVVVIRNVLEFRQKWLYSGKLLHSGKVVVYRSGKMVVIWAKMIVFRRKWLYSVQKLLHSGKSGCTRANWLYSGKVGVFGKDGCIWGKNDCIPAKVAVFG